MSDTQAHANDIAVFTSSSTGACEQASGACEQLFVAREEPLNINDEPPCATVRVSDARVALFAARKHPRTPCR